MRTSKEDFISGDSSPEVCSLRWQIRVIDPADDPWHLKRGTRVDGDLGVSLSREHESSVPLVGESRHIVDVDSLTCNPVSV